MKKWKLFGYWLRPLNSNRPDRFSGIRTCSQHFVRHFFPCVCMHVWLIVCVQVCMHVCKCGLLACVQVCKHVCMCANVHVCKSVCTYVCTGASIAPEAMLHFHPISDFPLFPKKISDWTPRKIFPILPFPRKFSDFHPPKFLTTFLVIHHKYPISPYFPCFK